MTFYKYTLTIFTRCVSVVAAMLLLLSSCDDESIVPGDMPTGVDGGDVVLQFFLPTPASDTRSNTWGGSYESEAGINDQETRIKTLDIAIFDPTTRAKLAVFSNTELLEKTAAGYSCELVVTADEWEEMKSQLSAGSNMVTMIFLANKDADGNGNKLDLSRIAKYDDLRNYYTQKTATAAKNPMRPVIYTVPMKDGNTKGTEADPHNNPFTDAKWADFSIPMWGIRQLDVNTVTLSYRRHNIGSVNLLRAWAKIRFVFGPDFWNCDIIGKEDYVKDNVHTIQNFTKGLILGRTQKSYTICPSLKTSASGTEIGLNNIDDVTKLDREGVYNVIGTIGTGDIANQNANGAGPIAFREYRLEATKERIFEVYVPEYNTYTHSNTYNNVLFDVKYKDASGNHIEALDVNNVNIKLNKPKGDFNIVRNHIYEYKISSMDMNVTFDVLPWEKTCSYIGWSPLAYLLPANVVLENDKFVIENGDIKGYATSDEESRLCFVCRPRYFDNLGQYNKNINYNKAVYDGAFEVKDSIKELTNVPHYVIGNAGSNAGAITTAGATFTLEFTELPPEGVRWTAHLEDIDPSHEGKADFKFSTGDATSNGLSGKVYRSTHGHARRGEKFEIEIQAQNNWTQYETTYYGTGIAADKAVGFPANWNGSKYVPIWNSDEADQVFKDNGVRWADTFERQVLTDWGKKVDDPINGRMVACWFYITVSLDGEHEQKLVINPARPDLEPYTLFKDGRFFAGTDTDILIVQPKARPVPFETLAREHPLLKPYFNDKTK